MPVTVRSASTAGKIVIKSCVQTWQAYNLWGGYDLYKDTAGAYSNRSLVVSLDRPYDSNGADYFLTYERNVVKLAEHLGLNLAYVTSMDIAADPHLLDGASALLSLGHDEYWTPEERANVTAARNAGVNLAFLGANAVFRRTRLQSSALGAAREVVCYKTSYTEDPLYRKDPTEVTSDWREPPNSDPESSLIGTIYEGYPCDASVRGVQPVELGVRRDGRVVGHELPAPGRRRVRPGEPGLPGAAPHRGAVPLAAHVPGRVQLRGFRLLHAFERRGRLQLRARCAGWRPSTATSRTASAAAPRHFVRQVTTNILHAFADGPAAAKHPAHDNLVATREYVGDPVGNPQNLQ